MKKLVILLAMATLLIPSASALDVNKKDLGYVAVTSNETVSIVPNRASISVSVETTDLDSKRASQRNNEITANIIKAIKLELSSDKKSSIQTSDFSIRPNYKVSKDNVAEKTILNYTVVNTIKVKTSNLEKVSTIIDTAINNRATRVGTASFSIEDTDEFATQATDLAIKNARMLADTAAKSLNQKVVGVKSIRVNVYQQNANGVRMLQATLDVATPIEAGKIQLNANVDAQFYVK